MESLLEHKHRICDINLTLWNISRFKSTNGQFKFNLNRMFGAYPEMVYFKTLFGVIGKIILYIRSLENMSRHQEPNINTFCNWDWNYLNLWRSKWFWLEYMWIDHHNGMLDFGRWTEIRADKIPRIKFRLITFIVLWK